MKTFISGVLGVTAIGVLLIAYGMFNPRVTTADSYAPGRPAYATDSSEHVGVGDANVAAPPPLQIRCAPGQRAAIRQVAGAMAAECLDDADAPRATRASLAYPVSDVRSARQAQAVREDQGAPVQRRTVTPVEGKPARNWKRTAMVISGSSAAGAGIGALIGGKKGALIGAAIGGGAGTVYEIKK